MSNIVKPFQDEIEEAQKHPNGWVYRIAGKFSPDNGVPPEAIVGAWKVDPAGNITGSFIANPKYDAARWLGQN